MYKTTHIYIIAGFVALGLSLCSLSLNKLSDDTLELLEVKNEKLTTILDNIISHEMGCDYYKPDLLFAIHSQFINDTNILLIGSIGIETTRIGNELGCIEYQGHLFIVYGHRFDNTLFAATNKRKKMSYHIPNEMEDKCVETKKLNLEFIEDDSFSFWYYEYNEGNFVFVGKSTYCE
jgi:hypothetical protein